LQGVLKNVTKTIGQRKIPFLKVNVSFQEQQLTVFSDEIFCQPAH